MRQAYLSKLILVIYHSCSCLTVHSIRKGLLILVLGLTHNFYFVKMQFQNTPLHGFISNSICFSKCRPVYIESCVVVKCSFEYLSVVYHTPSLTNYKALSKRLKQTRTNFYMPTKKSLHNKKLICRLVYFRVRPCRVRKAE